jgi:hypothetical protein
MPRGGKRPGAGRKPGAVSKQKRELAALAKEHASDALQVLITIAKKGESEAARVSAANSILDRGYGKAPQAMKHSGSIGTYDLTKLSEDELDRLESILGPLALAGGDQGGEGEA